MHCWHCGSYIPQGLELSKIPMEETFTDEAGVIWVRPTAYAYSVVCRALQKAHAKALLDATVLLMADTVCHWDWGDNDMEPRADIEKLREAVKVRRDLR